ncbi:hypothetical protein C3489_10850 [Streptomyces sp. Ru71]|nr:hypothetical protein C3489_10850 [Streptomyces sp. Ru71]
MTRDYRFHLDMEGHSVTVQTRHATREAELLVDGKVVGYLHALGHREPASALTAELAGDPPRPFSVMLHASESAEGAPTCVLEIAGRRHPMPEVALARSDSTPSVAARPSLRAVRRLFRQTVRGTRRRR